MKADREQRRSDGRRTPICENEGCGRPADGRWCDSCSLEWTLFHREQRDPRRVEAERSPQR